MSTDHKSFLKWAGGKIKLLPKLRELGIERGNRYIEPFVGSGVVALNMPHKEIIIADTNDGLIALWNVLQSNPNANVHLKQYFFQEYNNIENYYKLRTKFNRALKSGDEDVISKLFLYLNKHCFNGLCRFNSSGEYNVPFNHRKTPPAFPEREVLHAIEASKRMSILKQGFMDTMKMVKRGDMVYMDPPYIPVSKSSSFTTYSKDGFSIDDHKNILLQAECAAGRGATVIISNNDVPLSRMLYNAADELHLIDVQKNISCKGDGRKKQGEVMAVYRPR